MSELLERDPFDVETEPRLVIIADWLPPDFGAVGQYMQIRAQALAERGHHVTLIGLSSTTASRKREARGMAGTLEEIRLLARPVPRTSLLGRLLWTICADLRLIAAAFAQLRAADGILFTGSPPFLIHLLVPLRFLWRGRLVYRITDFYPEVLIAARGRPSLLLSSVLALTNFWRRRISAFEVLGVDQVQRLRAAGIPEDGMVLVRDGSPVSFGAEEQPERLPPALMGSCVLLYAGNYGVAHEVRTVAEGYELHHRAGTGRVRLWLCAAGSGADEIEARLTRSGVPFHRSQPVPIERLAGLLKTPDAHLVALKDSFVGYVMPSKIYACIDSQKPVIFVGSAESDVELLARPLESGVGYWRVDCGNATGFASVLELLADRSSKSLQPERA